VDLGEYEGSYIPLRSNTSTKYEDVKMFFDRDESGAIAHVIVGSPLNIFRRAPDSVALPRIDVVLAWLHSLLILVLLANLVQTLMGDLSEFEIGVPTITHVNLLVSNANYLLGMVVVLLAIRQWQSGAGGMRSRYSLFALGALVNIRLGIYFRVPSYAFAMLWRHCRSVTNRVTPEPAECHLSAPAASVRPFGPRAHPARSCRRRCHPQRP
jgi:hypothetical protein